MTSNIFREKIIDYVATSFKQDKNVYVVVSGEVFMSFNLISTKQ